MKKNVRCEKGSRTAKRAGLRYVHDLENGWSRRRRGKGFTYHGQNGKRLTGARTLRRIETLGIPPAWDQVRICPDPSGHIQATGRDAKGRLQYIYHPEWTNLTSATKFDKLSSLGECLPKLRRRVRRDLAEPELSKNRVMAAVVRLIDKAHLRVGNGRYAEANGSHGATTLTADHVALDDIRISLGYPGKSGRQIEASITDAKVADVIRECEEIDGQYLFSYVDANGEQHAVTSSDINIYLQDISGQNLTAKDFRTWWGSVIALRHLHAELEAASEQVPARSVAAAVSKTADEMSHTKAVCRSSYIHPGLITAFEAGKLQSLLKSVARRSSTARAELVADEKRFVAILPKLETRTTA